MLFSTAEWFFGHISMVMNVNLEKMNPFGYCIATQNCCNSFLDDTHLFGFIPLEERIWNFVAWEIIRQCGTGQHFVWVSGVGCKMIWKSESSDAALGSYHVILFWLFNTSSTAGLICICWCRIWQLQLKIFFFCVPLAFSPSLFVLWMGTWSCPLLQCKPAGGDMGRGKKPQISGKKTQICGNWGSAERARGAPFILSDHLCPGFRQY